MEVKQETVYACPRGHYEKTKERAVAWHLEELLRNDDDKTTVSFSDCLELIKKRQRVIALLKELDDA